MTPEEAIEQYKLHHQQNEKYGGGGAYKNVKKINDYILPECRSILDFGCGKGGLVNALKGQYDIVGYDPAVPRFAKFPDRVFDLVVSFDVLEHLVKPFDEDFRKIDSKASKQIMLGISCRPAKAILPNGLNAHTLVFEPHHWYKIISNQLKKWVVTDTHFSNRFFVVNLLRA